MRTCAIFIIASLLSICQSVATTKNPAMSGIVEYEPLQDSHLIVRGTIAAVRQESVNLADWFSKNPSEDDSRIYRQMETIEVVVAEVLKGTMPDAQIKFMVADGWSFTGGQEVIICAKRIQGRNDAAFFTNVYIGMYVRGGGDVWTRCLASKAQPEETLTSSEVRRKIQEGDLSSVSRAAELVVRGTITSTAESSFATVDGKTGKLMRYTLSVSEVMKGRIPGDEVEFVVPKVNASYVPVWYRAVPRGIDVGQEWIVLLRESELGYYLFSGPNSALMVKGEDLIYDMAVTYPRGVKEARSVIRAEASDDQR